jgi:hypothetical protein
MKYLSGTNCPQRPLQPLPGLALSGIFPWQSGRCFQKLALLDAEKQQLSQGLKASQIG